MFAFSLDTTFVDGDDVVEDVSGFDGGASVLLVAGSFFGELVLRDLEGVGDGFEFGLALSEEDFLLGLEDLESFKSVVLVDQGLFEVVVLGFDLDLELGERNAGGDLVVLGVLHVGLEGLLEFSEDTEQGVLVVSPVLSFVLLDFADLDVFAVVVDVAAADFLLIAESFVLFVADFVVLLEIFVAEVLDLAVLFGVGLFLVDLFLFFLLVVFGLVDVNFDVALLVVVLVKFIFDFLELFVLVVFFLLEVLAVVLEVSLELGEDGRVEKSGDVAELVRLNEHGELVHDLGFLKHVHIIDLGDFGNEEINDGKGKLGVFKGLDVEVVRRAAVFLELLNSGTVFIQLVLDPNDVVLGVLDVAVRFPQVIRPAVAEGRLVGHRLCPAIHVLLQKGLGLAPLIVNL